MYPELEEVKALARSGDYGRIPVCRELYADRFTTVEVMRTLRAAGKHCFLLESADNNQRWGRYSFLGYEPVLELTCADGLLRIREYDADGLIREKSEMTEHPATAIRAVLRDHKSPRIKGMPPFCGGLVGYFSYDYLKYSEPKLRGGECDEDFQDVDLMLFDKVIAFDHYRQKLLLIAGVPASDADAGYLRAWSALDEMESLLESGAKAAFRPLRLKEELKPRFSKRAYCAMVERGKKYIREGDIFQVVLSNPQKAAAEGSLFDTYRVLRTTNPSPYMFYFSSDDIEIAGASPETLARLEDGIIYTFPLAGTRRRGVDQEEDEALERELLADEKELAEHNMLVDLGRNDLGRVSCLNSVKVEKYLNVLRFSHVMHIGSTVSGKLRDDRDAVDAVDAILPAGTLSGAPKIRACEIISELEGGRRGIYGGAVGYLDFSGNMDTCIAIRLAYKKHGCVCVQAGAGIVADSVPEREFQECADKAQAVVRALRAAEGGL